MRIRTEYIDVFGGSNLGGFQMKKIFTLAIILTLVSCGSEPIEDQELLEEIDSIEFEIPVTDAVEQKSEPKEIKVEKKINRKKGSKLSNISDSEVKEVEQKLNDMLADLETDTTSDSEDDADAEEVTVEKLDTDIVGEKSEQVESKIEPQVVVQVPQEEQIEDEEQEETDSCPENERCLVEHKNILTFGRNYCADMVGYSCRVSDIVMKKYNDGYMDVKFTYRIHGPDGKQESQFRNFVNLQPGLNISFSLRSQKIGLRDKVKPMALLYMHETSKFIIRFGDSNHPELHTLMTEDVE